MVRISSSGPDHVKVTFAWPEDGRDLAVISDVNGWDLDAHRLRRRSNATRSIAMILPRDAVVRFRYAAITDAGIEYFDDPAVDLEPNGLGQTHGILDLAHARSN